MTNKINKIQCIKCQKKKGVSADVLEKRIKKAGSLEALLATYTCRACRKGIVDDPNKPKITKTKTTKTRRKRKKKLDLVEIDAEGNKTWFWQKQGYSLYTPQTPFLTKKSSEQYQAAYGTSCALPKLYLDNGRFCDGCPFLLTCTCPLKRTNEKGYYLSKAQRKQYKRKK